MENAWMPLLGGVLIGLSSTTMLGGIGRITGISGIFSNLLKKPSKESLWQVVFIAGLVLGGLIMFLTNPKWFEYGIEVSKTQAAIAGVLVGFGTRLGSGCTSGHGVCGLARLSERSLVATLTFMAFGILTVLVRRLVWGL